MDTETNEFFFNVNFWNYRTIVEVIRSLRLLSDERVDRLQEPFTGAGLTKDEISLVTTELRSQVLPCLEDDERLLLDGTKTKTSDDGTFYKSDEDRIKNYSINKAVLIQFIEAIENCNGFEVC
ncbi:MAG: hypothetical protein KME09_25050 [Pleurocapsa minor HA4230-MV1]|jgi:hypothetical protein|nr:hypothetical protein [Pleurocapsa minor HA4230-MV1]